MKKLFGILGAFILSAVIFSSCQGDPADHDLFIGTYKGYVGFTKLTEGEFKADKEGSVTVSKVGKNYSFSFSNDIPALQNIEFKESDDKSFTAVGLTGSSFIKIKDGHLNLLVVKIGEGSWAADCKR